MERTLTMFELEIRSFEIPIIRNRSDPKIRIRLFDIRIRYSDPFWEASLSGRITRQFDERLLTVAQKASFIDRNKRCGLAVLKRLVS
jgi:hypothetical protein